MEVIERGICWDTLENPTITGYYSIEGSGIGKFNSKIDSLLCQTQYHVRAYASNEKGMSYGNQISFYTDSCFTLPTVSTSSVHGITYNTAITGGEILDAGGANIRERGVCWNYLPNPTIKEFRTFNGIGSGTFASQLTDLTCDTTYYLRAYAINAAGTGYGEQIAFKTSPCPVLPTVKTKGNLYA